MLIWLCLGVQQERLFLLFDREQLARKSVVIYVLLKELLFFLIIDMFQFLFVLCKLDRAMGLLCISQVLESFPIRSTLAEALYRMLSHQWLLRQDPMPLLRGNVATRKHTFRVKVLVV